MKKDTIFAVMEALREIQKNNATVFKRTINPEYFGTSKSLYNTSLALLTGRQLKEEAENKNKDEDEAENEAENETKNVKINPELKDEKDMNDDNDDEGDEDEDWGDEDWNDEDKEEKEDTEEDENKSEKDNEEDDEDKEKKNKNVEESVYKNYSVTYEKGAWQSPDHKKITKKLDLTKSKAFNPVLDGEKGEKIRYPQRIQFLLKHHDDHQNTLKSGFTMTSTHQESNESMLFTKEELKKIKNILKGRS